jgi:CMP/dCMP kinase
MTAVPVLAIDGPSGSGKGTVSRRLAAVLGWQLLDSGALYRLVALAGLRSGLAADDVAGHARLAHSLDVSFGARDDGSELVLLGGADVTGPIREETISQGASRVAAWMPVREALLERQRAFATPPGLVADGRDMGTVVFPAASLKIYLTATADERALRRYKQLKDKGSAVSLPALSREIAERDERDSTRAVAPLRPAPDALLLDSTGRSVEQVVAQVLAAGRQRSLWP